jgi:hypothetical protein
LLSSCFNGPQALFDTVRQKSQRFLTVTSAITEPSPMDWIFEAWSYGLKICYTTAVTGQGY